jgi:hypothetical protein
MPSVVGIGCCSDHTSGTAPPWVVPNSWRAAATTALSGFHSAMTRSQGGMFWVGTNTLEMNPSRNAGSMDSVSAACGLEAIMPSQMPHWRDALRQVAESIWDVCQTHPWYPEAIMVRPPLTPNGAAGLDLCLSIFDGYDLDIGTKMLFVGMIQYSVVGAALMTAGEGRTRDRMDLTEEEVMEQGAPFIKAMVESGRYPRVVEFITKAEHISEMDEIMRNVDLILDGIATRLP